MLKKYKCLYVDIRALIPAFVHVWLNGVLASKSRSFLPSNISAVSMHWRVSLWYSGKQFWPGVKLFNTWCQAFVAVWRNTHSILKKPLCCYIILLDTRYKKAWHQVRTVSRNIIKIPSIVFLLPIGGYSLNLYTRAGQLKNFSPGMDLVTGMDLVPKWPQLLPSN